MKTRFLQIIFLVQILAFTVYSQSKFLSTYKNLVSFDASELLIDSTEKLTINEIVTPKYQAKFFEAKEHLSTIGNAAVKWIKYTVEEGNKSAFFIEGSRYYYNIDLYVPIDNGFYHQKTGQVTDRNPSHATFNFSTLYIPSNMKGNVFYVRVKGPDFPVGLAFNQYHPLDYIDKLSIENYTEGIFTGICFIMILYSFFLAVLTREIPYLFYFLYLISFLSFYISTWDTWNRYYDFLVTPFAFEHFTFPYMGMTIFMILYCRYFIKLEEKFSLFSIISWVVIFIRMVIFLIGFIKNDEYFHRSFVDFCCLIPTYFFVSYYAYKNKISRFLWLGLTLLFFGMYLHDNKSIIGILAENFNFFNADFFSIFNLGTAEILFFTIALADRYRMNKKEKDDSQGELIRQLKENELLKDRMNKELEGEIEKRTRELRLATTKLAIQSQEISRMNSLLQNDNTRLVADVKKISQERALQKEMTFDEFKKIYPDDESCLSFLANLKWSEGFKCKKCENDHFNKGNSLLTRKCSRCNYIESPTSHTIFHNLKFSLLKAFYMVFLVNTRPEITLQELSEILEIRLQTVWKFRQKIQERTATKVYQKLHKKDGWSAIILNIGD
jgi:hypothetical protein